MNLKSVCVDSKHIFNYQDYKIKEHLGRDQIKVVQKSDSNQYYYLIQKQKKFIKNHIYSFLKHAEESFELIHPSILRISGFSIEKPYLYYNVTLQFNEYSIKTELDPLKPINSFELNDETVQIVFLGIASGISYLLSKGYYFSNFSENCIIISKSGCPKLIDYINFDDIDNINEIENQERLIIKYSQMIQNIINIRIEKNSQLQINPELIALFNRCKQKSNIPTFGEFIEFFQSSSYIINDDIITKYSFKKYLSYLKLVDVIDYDNFMINDSVPDRENEERRNDFLSKSVQNICFYYYKNKNMNFFIDSDEKGVLNRVPDYYIKKLANLVKPLYDRLIGYLYYEDINLLFPDWKTIITTIKNPFEIYKELINRMKSLKKEMDEIPFYKSNREYVDDKLAATRFYASQYLKKAAKNSNDAEIKIELAVQYIKGDIFPYNVSKALNILESITNVNNISTQNLIQQMKIKINSKLKESSINSIINKTSPEQQTIIQNAENGDVLSLLYVGFCLFFGFNCFPISRSLSIQYYRRASKLSPNAMSLIGYLYLNGIIFPRNFIRARKCFKRAADSGCIKAKIIDGILRKHLYRIYLISFDAKKFFNYYLSSVESIYPNDSLVFPLINNKIENNNYISESYLIKTQFVNDGLYSNKSLGNVSTCLESTEFSLRTYEKSKASSLYSHKILLSSDNIEDTNDVKQQMFIAKSYFNGENDFPVNYEKACCFYKKAADNGDSEAQWRFAMMCSQGLGIKSNIELANEYFEKAIKQNNEEGKFYFSIFLKYIKKAKQYKYETFLIECCNSGNLEAIYQYAMDIENTDAKLEKSIELYKKAADQGHFDSLIRLVNSCSFACETELYEKYLNLSVGIFNESLMVEIIDFYDNNENYKQSNILIQIGIMINYELFSLYYCDHLLFGKGMAKNIEKAKSLAVLAFDSGYPKKYLIKYVFIMLKILVSNNEQENALKFLFKYKNFLSETYRKDFLYFYQKFDKNLAAKYFITVNYCNENYRYCQRCLMELTKVKDGNKLMAIDALKSYVKEDKNYFAMSILGKLYKQGKYVGRNLPLAIDYFNQAAERGCHESYYYLGKEYFYGRFLDQDFKKAKHYLRLALNNDGDPRAGYYLQQIPGNSGDIESLQISASYGYKRALYEYGYILFKGKNKKIGENKSEGCRLIKQAAYQHYEKGINFCKSHDIQYNKDELNFCSTDEDSSTQNDKSLSSYY